MDDQKAAPLPLPAGYSLLADLASIPDQSVEFAGTDYHLTEMYSELQPGAPYGVDGDVVSKRHFATFTGAKPNPDDTEDRTPFIQRAFDATVSRAEVITRLLPPHHKPIEA